MGTLHDPNEDFDVRETGVYGKSLFAMRPFTKGEIVLVASGRIVTYHTDYTIPIDTDLMIEPRIQEGNPAAYLCHSCDPNVGVRDRSLFVAMRDIGVGEEIRTHYGFIGYEFGHEMTADGMS